METFNEIFAAPFIVGIVFLLIGMLMLIFPPHYKNWFYGYRTPTSRQSKESWDFSQKYSANRMIESAILMLAISAYTYFVHLDDESQNIISLLLVTGSVAYVIISTEIALNKNFPNK